MQAGTKDSYLLIRQPSVGPLRVVSGWSDAPDLRSMAGLAGFLKLVAPGPGAQTGDDLLAGHAADHKKLEVLANSVLGEDRLRASQWVQLHSDGWILRGGDVVAPHVEGVDQWLVDGNALVIALDLASTERQYHKKRSVSEDSQVK